MMRKILLLIFIILLSGCTEQEIIDQSVQYEMLSSFDYYPEIEERALAWDQGAVPVRFSITIISPFTALKTPGIDVTFESREKLGETIAIRCSMIECEEYIFKIDYSAFDYIDPINMDEIKLDSEEILSIAIQNGASYYLQTQGSSCSLRIVWRENKLVWYGRFTTSYEYMGIFIDPITGEVVELTNDRE